MDIDDVKALYYITAIDNMGSICERGILSYHMAKKIPHESIAMDEIQEKRIKVMVPVADRKGISLHNFAPLYFDSWNPMLSKLRQINEKICIIALRKEILNLPGAIIADRNASSKYCKFGPSSDGLKNIEKEDVFRQNWKDQDEIIEWEKRSKKCAELLVPGRISSEYFLGAVVVSDDAETRLRQQIGNRLKKFKIIIDRSRFF